MRPGSKNIARTAIPLTDVESFAQHLTKSRRIVALVGAGLSAASGLPTFRGAGGLWRTHNAQELATPEAFKENPDLVWQFYSYRRHMALKAKPNKAHYALAELARKNKDFITLSQNVDGLSQRAEHPLEQLHLLHGSLFDIKCTDFYCNYTRRKDFTDPIVPGLAIPKKSSASKSETRDEDSATQAEAKDEVKTEKKAKAKPKEEEVEEELEKKEEKKEKAEKEVEKTEELESDEDIDISDISNHIPNLSVDELPKCPECEGLLRPGVVWFNESLPKKTLEAVEEWMDDGPIDLILVIGTSSQVYPAAAYVDDARERGARVAMVNMEEYSPVPLRSNDWFFKGDASSIIPDILKGVVGEV